MSNPTEKEEIISPEAALNEMGQYALTIFENLLDYQDLFDHQSWAFDYEAWETRRSHVIGILDKAGINGTRFAIDHKIQMRLNNEEFHSCEGCKGPHDQYDHCSFCNTCLDHCKCDDEPNNSNQQSPELSTADTLQDAEISDMETEEITLEKSCPSCGGKVTYIGLLYGMIWYRCRQCTEDHPEKDLKA